MKAQKLLYPPGTRVVYLHDFSKEHIPGFRKSSIIAVVVRVTANGWYTYETQKSFDFSTADKSRRMVMKWIAEQGYVLDTTARAIERVPTVSEAIRRRLREITQ